MCAFVKELIVFLGQLLLSYFLIPLNVTRIKPRLLNILFYRIKGLTQPKES